MLKLESITGGWGPTTIVEDLSLEIGAGEAVSVIGRNGVGKTTTLELLVGRADLRGGRIHIDGQDITARRIFQRNEAGIGYVPQGREVFPSLTVGENLLVARRPGFWSEARLYELFPSLGQRTTSLGAQLSGGEQQMLSVARALIGNPKVLLMDEPTEGLAPIVVEQMIAALRQLAGTKSMAILLVEQAIDVALDLSSRCLVMERGQVIHAGTTDAYRADPTLLQGLMGFGGPAGH